MALTAGVALHFVIEHEHHEFEREHHEALAGKADEDEEEHERHWRATKHAEHHGAPSDDAHPHSPPRPRNGLIFGLLWVGLFALALALATYSIARRMARRLERLRDGVEALGGGNLQSRVRVDGHDEIAALARSFNTAAAQIESLVTAHKHLLANASHELRTPLARIRLALGILAARGASDNTAGGADAQTLQHLEQDIAELDDLVSSILLASRLEALPSTEHLFERVDLLALSAEMVALHNALPGAKAEASGEIVEIQGDEKLLRRMLRNLLENARRYAPQTTTRVSVQREGDHAILEVRDHGPGIPSAEHEKIFEPFFRGSTAPRGETSSGTGLGLSLARQIARRHGGELTCRDNAEGGACFSVRLPLGVAAAKSA